MLNKTGSYLLESAETMDIYYTTFYNLYLDLKLSVVHPDGWVKDVGSVSGELLQFLLIT